MESVLWLILGALVIIIILLWRLTNKLFDTTPVEIATSTTGRVFLTFYLSMAGLFAFYFNFLYLVDHGFWKWLMLGEIIPTLQGLIWPYYLFILIEDATSMV